MREEKIPHPMQQSILKTKFDVNEVIVFNGSRSSDPDSNDLSLEWNFGDGSTSSKGIDASYTTMLESIQ